jgi:hypothetical protein
MQGVLVMAWWVGNHEAVVGVEGCGAAIRSTR